MNARIPDAYEEFVEGPGSGQSFNFTSQLAFPTWGPGPSTTGSTLGVPPADYIAGMQPASTNATSDAAATAVLQRGAGSHPVFWAITIFMIGIVLLGFVSHMEVKRRG